MAFQKYQGEQVNQIPAGYVEAMGSMGKAYQQIGASVAAGITEAGKKAEEEAKTQGALSPFIKNDQRIQSVESMIAGGYLTMGKDGNVAPGVMLDEKGNKVEFSLDKFGPAGKSAIDFYNQTGGDGSKLKGDDLIKFASRFEAQQKYDAVEASKANAKMKREEMQAKINKMNAEALALGGKAAGNAILAETDTVMPSATPAMSPLPVAAVSPSYSANRYLAGSDLTNTLNKDAVNAPSYNSGIAAYAAGQNRVSLPQAKSPAPVTATDIEVPGVAAPAPISVQAPFAIPLSPTTTDTKAAFDQQTFSLSAHKTTYSGNLDANAADYSSRLKRLSANPGTTTAQINELGKQRDAKDRLAKEMYDANVALTTERTKSVLAQAEEVRKAQAAGINVTAEGRAVTAEGRAAAAEGRAAAAASVAATKANIELGTPAPSVAVPASQLVAGEYKSGVKGGTFQENITNKMAAAGNIPGYVQGTGTLGAELEDKASKRNQEILDAHPALWNIGMFSPGAKEYMYDNAGKSLPTSASIPLSIRAKVQDELTGYAESQTFLVKLKELVDNTDENGLRNYLDRMLPFTLKPGQKVTGDMMNQFGVAAFRKGIVSGGNFSDADREYVAKLITNINSLDPFKNKDVLKEQTQALAEFMDSKYRATLNSQGITVDLGTARKYLEREGKARDVSGDLTILKQSENYYKTFGFDSSKVAPTSVGPETTYNRIIKQAEIAEAKGNKELSTKLRSSAQKVKEDFEASTATAAEKAKALK